MKHGRIFVVAASLLALAPTTAVAFWTAHGSGSGTASVGTLLPATTVVATSLLGSGTVVVKWAAGANPGGETVTGYHVQRYAGSTPTDVCSDSLTSTNVGCSDTGVPNGTYTYTVTGIFRSWTATSSPSGPVTVADVVNVYFQAMDSCQQGLGGGLYALAPDGSPSSPLFEAPPDRSPGTVANANGACPLQQGNCVTITVGCVIFPNLHAGTYTIKYSRSAPPTALNTGGYAACTGGSACQKEYASVNVRSDGTVDATTTNVYPNGKASVWPNQSGHTTYAGTAADPVVFHTFGIGSGSCDGDADADDELTGTPSSSCAYPESQEAAACHPFPWSCTVVPPPPYQVTTYYDSVTALGSVSHFQKTVANGNFTAKLSWGAGKDVALTVYDSTGAAIQSVRNTSGAITINAGIRSTGTYKVKVNNYSSAAVSTTLVIDHSG